MNEESQPEDRPSIMPLPPLPLSVSLGFQNAVLPPGDYPLTFRELRQSVLVHGPLERTAHWDGKWRSLLVDNLEILVGQLWSVGISEIYIDGSFVEEKDHPNDIDGYFEIDPHMLMPTVQRLNAMEGSQVWTWDPASRQPYRGSTKRQLPMWHKYRVELYPHFPGLKSGILDEFGNNQPFPAAFRKTRGPNVRPKGIVKIIKEVK